jgi:hypothetical protein
MVGETMTRYHRLKCKRNGCVEYYLVQVLIKAFDATALPSTNARLFSS